MEYKFTDLVLLIGTNPLPNFVVADYYFKKNKKLENIWLLYSEKKSYQKSTEQLAGNIKNLLIARMSDGQKKKVSIVTIPLSDVGDAIRIKQDLDEFLFDNLSGNCSVHFNYTGGTKVMSIHVYRSLLESRFFNRVEFSYLDARKFKIIYDSGDITHDLRESVFLSFYDLIKLHGFKRKGKAENDIYEDELKLFDHAIINNNVESFIENKPKNGKWFEYYIYKKLGEFEPLRNWRITKTEWQSDLYFELDVIIVKGYQLIGISCTVSQHKNECKRKGFEIIHRVRQIGGDEAKAVLVTFNNEPDILKDDLAIQAGGGERICVIGLADFVDCSALDNIKEFISKDEIN